MLIVVICVTIVVVDFAANRNKTLECSKSRLECETVNK